MSLHPLPSAKGRAAGETETRTRGPHPQARTGARAQPQPVGTREPLAPKCQIVEFLYKKQNFKKGCYLSQQQDWRPLHPETRTQANTAIPAVQAVSSATRPLPWTRASLHTLPLSVLPRGARGHFLQALLRPCLTPALLRAPRQWTEPQGEAPALTGGSDSKGQRGQAGGGAVGGVPHSSLSSGGSHLPRGPQSLQGGDWDPGSCTLREAAAPVEARSTAGQGLER